MNCSNCGTTVGAIETRCLTCGHDVGFPNVRAALADQPALDARYRAALDSAQRDGREGAVRRFEEKVKDAFAAINVDLRFLFFFLNSNNQLYGTYQLGVKAETRKAATAENDRHRAGVEGILFGTYGEEIRYAALSLGNGLESYGNYSLRLREVAVRSRASLLEENSYKFVERHNVRPKDSIPLGYRSLWDERHKLAVAKIGARISDATAEKDYQDALLANGGTRSDDDFIEVHIYGPLDINALESIRGKSKLKKNPDRALAQNAKEIVTRTGKVWIEE